jgi:hypothetical protein
MEDYDFLLEGDNAPFRYSKHNDIYYSPIDLWKIPIKYGLGKLFLNGGTPDDFFKESNDSYINDKHPSHNRPFMFSRRPLGLPTAMPHSFAIEEVYFARLGVCYAKPSITPLYTTLTLFLSPPHFS